MTGQTRQREKEQQAGLAVVYRLLDWPPLYELVQWVTAPGAHFALPRKIRARLPENSGDSLILDVGCGPDSWLARAGYRPVGLDIRPVYLIRNRAALRAAIVGSATALPFSSGYFHQVWSIGVLHHLEDMAAARVIEEMIRVCRRPGQVVILDSVLPLNVWARPVAYVTRRLDRGNAIRTQASLRALLLQDVEWKIERFTYTLTGLEALLCQAQVG